MNILEQLNTPDDLKLLLPKQLLQLAEEIRSLIIDTVSKNGGHLAPSLGTVELTIALYKIFDFPTDKLVWDVGHQAYTHKILSGRRDQFSTLRQKGGLTGFPKRSESPYDAFGVGHASTSISAALGMAAARDIDGGRFKVIAVIGDGAMSGGEAFEALNNVGALKKDMLIILNDNEMSISKNVGALSSYFSQIRTNPEYTRVKKDIGSLIARLPKVGQTFYKTAEILKDSVKNAFIAGGLFEEMGISYIGPVDGNNLPNLITILQRIKNIHGPVMLHILTKKGKGYPPAEKHPDKFHGIGRFNIETGQSVSKPSSIPTYTQIFSNTLLKIASDDKDIVAITAAMPGGTGLSAFARQYPERFFDVGIAEEHALTMAAGLASAGKKPVVALYSTFAQRGYDQILHDICLQNLPVTICLDRAGLVGEDGPTHHGVFDYSFLRNIPGITLMAPQDENELQHMLYTAIEHNGPIVLRYPRGQACGIPMDISLHHLPIGFGKILSDSGEYAIIAIGSMVCPALKAAEILRSDNILCSVINARFIKPLDKALLITLAQTKKHLITVEENVLAGGFGSAVLEVLSQNNISPGKITCLGLPDKFIPQGPRDELLRDYGLTAGGIAKTIKNLVNHQHN
ncbi:1-deoxy-D-xylulose-5-phosphate synthase [Pectinatus frisingensis]|uniref:1-deoxy-D-xylulose-5-phosphate synthase n=1 Tax=Pectinatus frisingensis TaxID=865 RepID=UPI0015F6424D|nr:1-deoxy-D-xylulose-5-phosphate synthase [Pectinatus frisingensis]